MTFHRVAIVDGCRTPFLRSGTRFVDLTSYDLGRMAVAGLLHRTRVDPEAVDMLVMGRVVPDPRTTNLAREVVFGTDLPDACTAYTVTMACVSSLQTVLDAARAIATGAGVAIAGGAELLSDAPLMLSRPLRKRLIAAQKARGVAAKLGLLRGLRLRHLAPERLAIAERTTGETMGENCERLTKRYGISREAQDEYAVYSHHGAARAAETGLLDRQIVPVWVPPEFTRVDRDNGVRADTSVEKLAALKPVFDRRLGTITAGNASFLTDGGAAVLMMSEERAEELGHEPMAFIRTAAVVGMDPVEELLLGPAMAIPRALAQAGLSLEEIEVVELHEAFAGQVLAVLRLLEDEDYARRRLGLDGAVGRIERSRLNAWGGSLSIGHPFGATGARLVTNACHRMLHEKARYAMVAACAAGALGVAMILERP